MQPQPKSKKAPSPELEDLHLRLDDHAKRMDDMTKAGEGLPHALLAMMGQEIDKRIKTAMEQFERKDKTEDRKMIRDMFGELFKQYEDQELEVTKEGTVETPEGVHKMTVTETRRRKAKE
jgi:hypothetical protein